MSSTEYWYLASPYSKYEEGLEAAFRHVCIARGALTRIGLSVYSPIAETHSVALYSGLDPLAHDLWMQDDAPKMHHACGLIVYKMPGWHISRGVGQERKRFAWAKKPVVYLEWPADDLAIGRLIVDIGKSRVAVAEGACCES